MTLFLDIDGVVNIEDNRNSTYMKTGNFLEYHLVANLNILINMLDCDIIISSSWRSDMDDLKSILIYHKFNHIDKIKGRTNLNNKTRSQQVLDYCKNNNITNYLVLDDSQREFSDNIIPINNIYFTDAKYGLTKLDIFNISKLIK